MCIAVNERATLLLGHVASAAPCVLMELGQDGCRVRTESEIRVERGARVELVFRLDGRAFRLQGILERTERTREVRIAFTGMSAGCEGELARVLGELAEKKPAGPGRAGGIADEDVERGQAERRRQRRYEVDSKALVFLVSVKANLVGRIVGVSMSGCSIRAEERFPVGIYRRVEVEFTIDGLPFRLPGVIQSMHDSWTAGIRFVDVSERKQEQLGLAIAELAEIRQEGQAAAVDARIAEAAGVRGGEGAGSSGERSR